jgi:hypothetical protein
MAQDTSAGGYVLEADSNLVVNAWDTITNEPIVNGGNYNVTNSAVLAPCIPLLTGLGPACRSLVLTPLTFRSK